MCATATQPQAVPCAAKDGAVRKRRRRAPAGGAADDCFACAKVGKKCDRRRPYCSQCLEHGSECSGYKTQLTWNVGVASRGKLRGLSLPISKSPPVSSAPKKIPVPKSRAAPRTVNNTWSDQDEPPMSRAGRDRIHLSPDNTSAPPTPFQPGYDYLSMSQPAMSQPARSPGPIQTSWGSMPYQHSHAGAAPAESSGPKYQKMGAHLAAIPITDILSSSIDSVSDIDYMSPISQSFSREDIPYMNSPGLMYDNYTNSHNSPVPQSPASVSNHMDHRAPTSCPSLVYAPSEPSSSLASHLDTFEAQLSQKLMRECDTLSK